MPAHPDATVQNVGEKVGDHMTRILSYFKPGAKIAVIVRRAGEPDQDFILTNDTLEEVTAAIERRKTDPRTVSSNT